MSNPLDPDNVRTAAELEELEKSRLLLLDVVGQLDHDDRRLGDALERTGGADRDVEARRNALRKIQDLNHAELAALERRLETLRRRLRRC